MRQKVLDAYNNKRINDYMRDRLLNAIDDESDEQLVDDAILDAEDASNMDVKSDQDYAIRFYIIRLGDDLLQDTFDYKMSDDEIESLVRYAISNADEKYTKDLVGLRILLYKWLCDKNKKVAHPNVGGMDHREPTYDINKWTITAKNMYMLMKSKKMDRNDALKYMTQDWDSDEKFKFDNWLRYYESNNTEKYDVKTASTKKEALLPSDMFNTDTMRSNVSPALMSAYKQKEDEEQRKREKQELILRTKKQMKSRLKSLWNLVHRFNDLLPKSSVDQVLNLIHYLDVSINKLQTEASIRDCMVRTAHQIKKAGFDEGADLLVKIADEPLAEKAIESVDTPTKVPRPDIQLSTIIDRLELLSKMLKSRDMIRSLASVDILLNELGFGSMFPELGDTQSKLNDAFSYASNKVEGVISKLRGTGQVIKPLQVGDGIKAPSTPKPEQIQAPMPAAKPTTEKMDTGELKETPVGKIQTELPRG